jgi:hypothetical protein
LKRKQKILKRRWHSPVVKASGFGCRFGNANEPLPLAVNHGLIIYDIEAAHSKPLAL